MRWQLLGELMWTDAAEAMYHAAPLTHGSARDRVINKKARDAAHAVHDSLFPTDEAD